MKSGFNEAPPTRKPSTSGCFANSSQLPAVTDPINNAKLKISISFNKGPAFHYFP